MQFWQDTDSLSTLLAAPFRVKTNGCVGLTIGDGGGSCAGQRGDCSPGSKEIKTTLKKLSEKSRAVGLVRNIDGGRGVVFSGICSLWAKKQCQANENN